jgi:predicted transcriptional regulator
MLKTNGTVASSDYFLIDSNEDLAAAETIFKGLASEPRLNILRFLYGNVRSVNDIATALEMPPTTVAMHIRVLEEAGLVRTELQPASRGRQKMCSRIHYDRLVIILPRSNPLPKEPIVVSMPIGAFTDCQVTPTCGLATSHSLIGEVDNPAMFYHPDRVQAQIIWFKQGYLEYRFPNTLAKDVILDSLQFSMEICSEAPTHADDWPSDITLWVNNVEIGTWTSPADFGSDRGTLTPEWWGDWSSQYGLLKIWRIAQNGCFVDGNRVSDITLTNLHLRQHDFISMRIGIKQDANYVGGLNLFGHGFGNYPQDIVMRLNYVDAAERTSPDALASIA